MVLHSDIRLIDKSLNRWPLRASNAITMLMQSGHCELGEILRHCSSSFFFICLASCFFFTLSPLHRLSSYISLQIISKLPVRPMPGLPPLFSGACSNKYAASEMNSDRLFHFTSLRHIFPSCKSHGTLKKPNSFAFIPS